MRHPQISIDLYEKGLKGCSNDYMKPFLSVSFVNFKKSLGGSNTHPLWQTRVKATWLDYISAMFIYIFSVNSLFHKLCPTEIMFQGFVLFCFFFFKYTFLNLALKKKKQEIEKKLEAEFSEWLLYNNSAIFWMTSAKLISFLDLASHTIWRLV